VVPQTGRRCARACPNGGSFLSASGLLPIWRIRAHQTKEAPCLIHDCRLHP